MKVAVEEAMFKDIEHELESRTGHDQVLLATIRGSRTWLAPRLTEALAACVPSAATWRPSFGTGNAATAAQSVAFAGLLSVWKFLRLSEALAGAWSEGPNGFHALVAVGSSRSAMEESARMVVAGERLRSVLLGPPESWATSVDPVARDLLSDDDTMGLGTMNAFDPALSSGAWRFQEMTQRAAPHRRAGVWFPGDEDRTAEVGHLYGILSTVVHPKGPGRALFRAKNFAGGVERLRLEPSQHALVHERAAALAGWAFAVDLTLSAWSQFISVAGRLLEYAGTVGHEPDPVLTEVVVARPEPGAATRPANPWAAWTPLPHLIS